MNRLLSIGVTLVLFCFGVFLASHTSLLDMHRVTAAGNRSYLGFDRNIYPGDSSLPALRKSFAFMSYWLSPPPGEKLNTWQGKRELLLSHGFGFLVLYSGRSIRTQK